MKKVSIIGHFGFGKNLLNGQTIKTKIVANELCRLFGETDIYKIDTHSRIKSLIKAPFFVLQTLKNSKNIIILPAHNGLRIYAPLLYIFNKIYNHKLHYVVIGGWLPEFIKEKKWLSSCLRNFDYIYVETITMKQALEKQGFKNIFIMPNCKELKILDKSELIYDRNEPFKLCTFSRVMKEKGIEDAIEVVKTLNKEKGRVVFTLDIYGQIDKDQISWFEELKNEFPNYITYGGTVPFDDSVMVIKSYNAIMFPTRFYTEGIPGTILDAYASGVPVIASLWESCLDIIRENITGITYEFNSCDGLKQKINWVYENQIEWVAMKANCIKESHKYLPSNAMIALLKNCE